MIQVTERSLNSLGLFISKEEPTYKILTFLMKLLAMGYISQNDVAYDVYHQQAQMAGSRIRFYKVESRRAFNTPSNITYNKPNSNITLRFNVTQRKGVTVTLDSQLKQYDNNVHLYTKYLDTTTLNLPKINSHSEIKLDVFKETMNEDVKKDNENFLERVVNFSQFFEFNCSKITTLAALANLYQSTSNLNVPLRTFAKLHKYLPAITTFKEVNKDARRKLIDLCTIFKNNKTIEKITNGIIKLEKSSLSATKTLAIEIAGIKILHENNFSKFNYLDHPAINFVTNFLEISDTFPILEAKISKEILTGI